MALNMLDKRSLMNEILPEVQISLNSTGIMVTSSRIAEPVIIPFDQAGKCPECKATELELDYMVTKEGCTIWCTRLKKQPRFVGFDCVYDLPGHTFIKIRNKARVFNVPHGFLDNSCKPAVLTIPPPLPPIPEEKPMDLSEIPLPPPPPEELAEEFMGSISAATIGMDIGTQTDQVSQLPPSAPPQELAEEFMANISAATTGMEPAQPSSSQLELAQQEQEQKEWESAGIHG